MRGITRHLLGQLLIVFLGSLFGISLLLVFAAVLKEGISNGVGGDAILRMIPYVVPIALRISIPLTVLLTVSIVYGRMSADQEVVAMKSMGISPLDILIPCWGFAVVVSLVAVCMNDLAVSWGRMGVQRVLLDSVEEIAYRMLRTQQSYSTHQFDMFVAGVDGDKLLRPYVVFRPTAQSPAMRIVATEAVIQSDPVEGIFKIQLTDGTIEQEGKGKGMFKGTRVIPIPIMHAIRKGDRSASPSQLALRDIPRQIREQRTTLDTMRSEMAATMAAGWTTGDYLTTGAWEGWQERWNESEKRFYRLRTEPWRRWANGFSCLFFVVVAAPLAILLKTANFFTTFAACFFPILVVYYPLLAYSVDRAKDGALSPVAVWLGNLVLLIFGIILSRRVLRY